MPDWIKYIRKHLPLDDLKREREDGIVEELARQLEDFYQEGLTRGRPAAEAEAFARRQIPDWESLKSDIYRMERRNAKPKVERWTESATVINEGGPTMFSTLFADARQDLLYGIRMLTKSPGFTLVAVLTLALGIGANSAVFSMLYNIFIRPIPVQDSSSLVLVRTTNLDRGITEGLTSIPDFLQLREENQVLDNLTAYTPDSFNLAGTAEPVQVSGYRVTPGFFSLLGVQPYLGRGFLPEEEKPGKGRVVVLSHALWQKSFGGQKNVVSQTCKLDGETYTVVGVMAQEFWFPRRNIDLWIPITLDLASSKREQRTLVVAGRLKPGISHEQADAGMKTLAARLAEDHPDTNTGWSVRVAGLLDLRPSEKMLIALLMASIGVILLIACANVANLLLARAANRQKEIAIRAALGASRGRVVRQLLAESLVLALLGSGAGFLLAVWSVSILEAASQGTSPLMENIPVDWPIFGYALLLAIISAFVFGLVPALQSSRPDLNETLKEAGRRSESGSGRQRLSKILVVSQVSLAVVLSIVAALLIHSLANIRGTDPGFDPDNLLVMSVALTPTQYPDDHQVTNFYQDSLERLQALPAVTAAGFSSRIPTTGSRANLTHIVTMEGQVSSSEKQDFFAEAITVSPGYLEALGVRLREGRLPSVLDTSQSIPVAWVTTAMAERYWSEQNPVGQRFRLGKPNSGAPWLTIAGVVSDVRSDVIGLAPPPLAYLPLAQNPRHAMTALMRTTTDPLLHVTAARSEIWSVDSEQPVFDVKTMNQLLYEDVQGTHVVFGMFIVFAAIALLLASIGIYGVISYSVSRRTHEIGIRLAMGAQPQDILALILRQGMGLAGLGVGIGLAGAFGVTQIMTSLLYGVTSTDPLTFAGVPLLLLGVALLACYLPARRATKIEPLVALRYE